MCKAIIDTCFIERFYKNTKIQNEFYELIQETGFRLLLHPYVYDNELKIRAFTDKMVKEGTLNVVEYKAFIKDDAFREYYRDSFVRIYNEFFKTIKAINQEKSLKMHELDENDDIFELRYAGSSLGDVHMIMMALFMELPIILSEDSDMSIILSIAKKYTSRADFELLVYRVGDVIDYIKSKPNHSISNSELKHIRRAFAK